ncbi:MAG: anaerobic ribonucleoside-triphosphate reductase activating protein [Lachnospiraceae bacterium]|nr:anaerobic ribonucleoside-triphosphate reductase activating protein [Lachnospiraceae bacterium]
MRIQGLQKLTLLDYPGKMAATIFTAGCNFRCPFCHNASLVTHIREENDIPTEQVLDFLHKRKGILEGVCITGGEPLLQPDLEDFIKEIKEMGYQVKLDTNGSQTRKLISLVEKACVDHVAMDVKNTLNKYSMTIGLNENDYVGEILAAVSYLKSDVVSYEFRTTIVREFHKREDMEMIGRWLKGAKSYYIQGFIDSGDLIVPGLRPYNKEVMQQVLEVVRQYVPNARLRGVE